MNYSFYETKTYLVIIKIVLYKVVKVLVTIVCFPSSRNYIFEKGILDPFSCVNTQGTIPKRQIDPTPDRVIKILNSVSSKEYDSLIIFQLA
jgi:hypothetical protein